MYVYLIYCISLCIHISSEKFYETRYLFWAVKFLELTCSLWGRIQQGRLSWPAQHAMVSCEAASDEKPVDGAATTLVVVVVIVELVTRLMLIGVAKWVSCLLRKQ